MVQLTNWKCSKRFVVCLKSIDLLKVTSELLEYALALIELNWVGEEEWADGEKSEQIQEDMNQLDDMIKKVRRVFDLLISF